MSGEYDETVTCPCSVLCWWLRVSARVSCCLIPSPASYSLPGTTHTLTVSTVSGETGRVKLVTPYLGETGRASKIVQVRMVTVGRWERGKAVEIGQVTLEPGQSAARLLHTVIKWHLWPFQTRLPYTNLRLADDSI